MRHPASKLILICTALWTITSARAATVERVAIGVHDGFTRLVFHLDEAVPYHLERPGGGDLILTLEGAGGLPKAPAIGQAEKPLTGLRFTSGENGVTARLSTAGPVRVKDFALTPDEYGGHRIVLDLSPAGRETPPEAPALRDATGTVSTAAVASSDPRQEPPQPQPAPTSAPVPVNETTASQPPEAVCASYEDRLDVNPWDMTALIEYGGCLTTAGSLAEARRVYEKILTFDPDFHRARLGLAAVYAAEGKTDLARAASEQVLLSNPPTPVVQQIQQALHTLPLPAEQP